MIALMVLNYIAFAAILLTTPASCDQNGGDQGIKEWEQAFPINAEFPYMARLEYEDKYKCDAVIIEENKVLTAAHCVIDGAANDYTIRAGLFPRTGTNQGSFQSIVVRNKVIHEQYTPGSYDFDIAVLTLERDFEFNGYVNTIQLAERSEMGLFANKTVIGVGFDEREHYVMEELIVNSKDYCRQKSPRFHSEMLCTRGADSDQVGRLGSAVSGSPLVADHNAKDPIDDILIGIAIACVSAANSVVRCHGNVSSMFVDIAGFRDWIGQHIEMCGIK